MDAPGHSSSRVSPFNECAACVTTSTRFHRGAYQSVRIPRSYRPLRVFGMNDSYSCINTGDTSRIYPGLRRLANMSFCLQSFHLVSITSNRTVSRLHESLWKEHFCLSRRGQIGMLIQRVTAGLQRSEAGIPKFQRNHASCFASDPANEIRSARARRRFRFATGLAKSRYSLCVEWQTLSISELGSVISRFHLDREPSTRRRHRVCLVRLS